MLENIILSIIKFLYHQKSCQEKSILEYLECDIVDHCNLNCAGCFHFCPLLSSSRFYDPENFKKDLKLIRSKVSNIKKFRILGGEPLLHKDINKIMQYSREILPNTDIRIVTNSILLPKMEKNFFETCRKYNIIIDISKYPIVKEDFSNAVDKLGAEDVRLGEIHICTKFVKGIFTKDAHNMVKTFNRCKAKSCLQLKDGKLYRCPMATFGRRYNEYFNENIPMDEGLDLYSATTESIIKFINTPFETCKYCIIEDDFTYSDWSVSKREQSEWLKN